MIKEKLRKLFHITSIREMSIEKLQKRKKAVNHSSIFVIVVGLFYSLSILWISGFTPSIWNRIIMIGIGISVFVLHLEISNMCDLESLEIKMELRIRELEQRLREK